MLSNPSMYNKAILTAYFSSILEKGLETMDSEIQIMNPEMGVCSGFGVFLLLLLLLLFWDQDAQKSCWSLSACK